MDNTNLNKLKDLEIEMRKYVKYLQEETYTPYRQIEDFTNNLHNIINDIENNSISFLY